MLTRRRKRKMAAAASAAAEHRFYMDWLATAMMSMRYVAERDMGGFCAWLSSYSPPGIQAASLDEFTMDHMSEMADHAQNMLFSELLDG
jgi:hypothetical protein